jgi:hypothetical protein
VFRFGAAIMRAISARQIGDRLPNLLHVFIVPRLT